MAILRDCSIWHIRLDPKKPNANFDPKNPRWEVQIRTSDPAQLEQWKAMKLRPKLLVVPEGKENEGEPILNAEGKKQWRVNLSRKSINSSGEKAEAPECVDGHRQHVNPATIGNGSIAHVKIFQYDWELQGKTGTKSIVMGIQLKRHIKRKPGEAFTDEETEVIEEDIDSDVGDTEASEATPKSSTPKPPPVDAKPEDAF